MLMVTTPLYVPWFNVDPLAFTNRLPGVVPEAFVTDNQFPPLNAVATAENVSPGALLFTCKDWPEGTAPWKG
jgi:hypothetical protein